MTQDQDVARLIELYDAADADLRRTMLVGRVEIPATLRDKRALAALIIRSFLIGCTVTLALACWWLWVSA